MNKFCYTLMLLVIYTASRAQHVEETYPDTLYCPNDTLILKFKNFPDPSIYTTSREFRDNGTNAQPDDYVTLYYGKDSIKLNYHNRTGR